MTNIISEVLTILPNAEKQGVISSDEKNSIKEILFDEGNIIVSEILEEYASSKNQSKLLEQFKQYLNDIKSDDEDKNYDDIGASPTLEGYKFTGKKKHKSNNKIVRDIGVSECELGMSPKVIINNKKK